MRTSPKTLNIDRFYSNFHPEPNSGCWIWTGRLATNRKMRKKGELGYGILSLLGNPKRVLAHRVSWELHRGPIPDDMQIDHVVCKLKCCVNPDHLQIITLLGNINQPDGGPTKNRDKTHCPSGHEYSDGNTYYDRRGRRCRICAKERNRRVYQEKRICLTVSND